MASFFRFYNTALIRRPLITQSATAAFLLGTGDVIAQQAIERQGKNHDFFRTVRLAAFGGAFLGPVLTKWFQFLNRIKFASPTRGVIYRVWLDQTLMSPIVVGSFFSSMSIMEGNGISGAMERLRDNYPATILRSWAVFTPAQIINFTLVPQHFRFGFISLVSLCWNIYLSAVNAQSREEEEHKHTA